MTQFRPRITTPSAEDLHASLCPKLTEKHEENSAFSRSPGRSPSGLQVQGIARPILERPTLPRLHLDCEDRGGGSELQATWAKWRNPKDTHQPLRKAFLTITTTTTKDKNGGSCCPATEEPAGVPKRAQVAGVALGAGSRHHGPPSPESWFTLVS